MSVYMVERNFKGISLEDLGLAKSAASDKAVELRQGGMEISYVRSVFVPVDGRCFCLFEAASEANVRSLNTQAGLPFENIVPVLEVTPEFV